MNDLIITMDSLRDYSQQYYLQEMRPAQIKFHLALPANKDSQISIPVLPVSPANPGIY